MRYWLDDKHHILWLSCHTAHEVLISQRLVDDYCVLSLLTLSRLVRQASHAVDGLPRYTIPKATPFVTCSSNCLEYAKLGARHSEADVCP